jgi:hypothetical protein
VGVAEDQLDPPLNPATLREAPDVGVLSQDSPDIEGEQDRPAIEGEEGPPSIEAEAPPANDDISH